jgi:hypothetical protein
LEEEEREGIFEEVEESLSRVFLDGLGWKREIEEQGNG